MRIGIFIFALLSVQCVMGQCVNQSFVGFEGGTNGSQVSSNALASSTAGVWNKWVFANPSNMITFTNLNQALSGTKTLCVGGTVNGSGTLSLCFGENGADDQYVRAYPYGLDDQGGGTLSTSTVASASCWIRSDMVPTNGAAQHDTFTLRGENDYILFYINSSTAHPANLNCGVESGSWEDGTQDQPFTNNVWYFVSAQFVKNGNHSLNLYGPNMDLIHSWTHAATGTGNPNRVNLKFQSAIQHGFHVYYDSLMMDFDTGTFPLLPDPPGINTLNVSGTARIGILRTGQ